jgi:flagellar assembly factor FliW
VTKLSPNNRPIRRRSRRAPGSSTFPSSTISVRSRLEGLTQERTSVQIETAVFGPVEIEESRLVRLTEPMPGFPGLTRFALLEPDPTAPFRWLQSLERRDICFVIADPSHFFEEYAADLRGATLADLEIEEPEQAAVAVVLTIPEDVGKATANLLAPLVFNTAKGLARQLILEGTSHPVRAPLVEPELRAYEGA